MSTASDCVTDAMIAETVLDEMKRRPYQRSAAAQSYYKSHDRCAVCWRPKKDGFTEVAHICGGSGIRSGAGDDPRNFVLLCKVPCHAANHTSGNTFWDDKCFPPISEEMLCGCKADEDRLDVDFLLGLRPSMGAFAPLPDIFYQERTRWQRYPTRPESVSVLRRKRDRR